MGLSRAYIFLDLPRSRDESCVKEFNGFRTKTNRLRAWNWSVSAPACVVLGVTTPAFATYETNIANIRDEPPRGASVPKRALIVLIRIALIVARASSLFHLFVERLIVIGSEWTRLNWGIVNKNIIFPLPRCKNVPCLFVYDVNSIVLDDTYRSWRKKRGKSLPIFFFSFFKEGSHQVARDDVNWHLTACASE